MDPISKFIIEYVIDPTVGVIMPMMILTFFAGIVGRFLILYTARTEQAFAKEFEKRIRKHFADPSREKVDSFYVLTKQLLQNTYLECFELRHKFKRRNLDYVTTLSDRIFLIQDGMQRLINDTLRQVRYLKRDHPPKMTDLTKGVFENNPVFNRIMGIFPVALAHEFINILPGLFIIGGIFGTFLGIAKGLPELGGMDLSNMEETKRTMDLFLVKISQAMIKSIVGIALSVLMSLINTLMAPENVYYNLINRFSGALENLWNETTTNAHDGAELDFVKAEKPNAGEKRAA